MSRVLDASTKAALSNDALHFFHLVTIEFGTPVRLTDHTHDLSYDFGSGSETFLSTARLGGIGAMTETLAPSNTSISLDFTGANLADISLALTEDFTDSRVIIRRGIFDTSGQTRNANIVGKPFIIFDGKAESFDISDDAQEGKSTVTWKIASHWANWHKSKGRKSNPRNAKQYYPNETGFDHVYNQIGERLWGRVRS